jgi:hypothetical protein
VTLNHESLFSKNLRIERETQGKDFTPLAYLKSYLIECYPLSLLSFERLPTLIISKNGVDRKLEDF